MSNKDIDMEIVSLESLRDITYTYQQIASMRMRKIKDSVIQDRDYYRPLMEVYHEVEKIYSETYHRAFKQNANGKSLAIFISSNTGLYGSVVREVFDLFVKDHAKSSFDIAVTGRLGKRWLDALNISKPYEYFDLPDDAGKEDAPIKVIFELLTQYSEVWVYHGFFANIANQPPKITKITQNFSTEVHGQQTLSFLFEPGIEKVLENFEKQLLYSFFDQSIYEASLAKHGSRMMSLDLAGQSIDKVVESTRYARIKYKHYRQNQSQMEQNIAFVARRTL